MNLLICGLLAIVIGLATAIWNIHIRQGQPDMFLSVLCGLMMGLGLFLILVVVGGDR